MVIPMAVTAGVVMFKVGTSGCHHLNYYCDHFTSLYLLLQASQYLICPSSQAILINVPYVGTFALLVGTEGNRKEYFCKLYLEQGTYTI